MTTKDICFIGIFAAAMVIVAQITIPLPGGVPMTLQTFIVPLAGAVLGSKKGAIAAVVYILLGAVGLPVFSGFRGGIGVIAGPTGGFVLSYPIMALVVGLWGGKRLWLILCLIAGVVINLGMGMVQFAFVTGNDLQTAFFAAVAPFVLIEAGKMIIVYFFAVRVLRLLSHML